jgi:hypothetical protein
VIEQEPASNRRVESGDEVLAAAPLGGRLARPHSPRWLAERFPKTARVLGMALLAAVSASWGGTEAHLSDQQDAVKAARGTVLLRLLGGGGGVSADPGDRSAREGTPGRLAFAVRNDGPAPVDLLAAVVHDHGISTLSFSAAVVAPPGRTVLIALPVNVDCTDPGLPEHPGALTLDVRAADGRLRQVTLAGPPPASQNVAPAVGDYYSLCGAEQTSITPDLVYDRLVTASTAADRTFSYRVTVIGRSHAAQNLLAAVPEAAGIPGLSITTSLATPVPLIPGVARPVTITVRADDCKRIGDTLGLGTMASSATATALALEKLHDGPLLDITPGDQRFQQTHAALAPPQSSAFRADILTQLLIACPALG